MHLGNFIESKFTESGMTLTAFAKRINTSPRNVYHIFKRESVDTEQLQLISKALNFDFFQLFVDKESTAAAEPSAVYTTSTAKPQPALVMSLSISMHGLERSDALAFVEQVQGVMNKFQVKPAKRK